MESSSSISQESDLYWNSLSIHLSGSAEAAHRVLTSLHIPLPISIPTQLHLAPLLTLTIRANRSNLNFHRFASHRSTHQNPFSLILSSIFDSPKTLSSNFSLQSN